MKLYYMTGACSLASRIILNETNTEFSAERFDPSTGLTESGIEFKTINAKGYVPFLVLDSGESISENQVILSYLGDLASERNLIPAAGTVDRMKFQELLSFIATEVHKNFTPFFAYKDASEDQKSKFASRLSCRISYIESVLADGRNYIFGERFTVADAYLTVVLNWAQFVSFDLSPFPRTVEYLERQLARESVQKSLRQEGLLTSEAS